MVYYMVNKDALNTILGALGVLNKGEELLKINNTHLVDSKQDKVGIVVGTNMDNKQRCAAPADLTFAELQKLQGELMELEMILLKEYNHVKNQVSENWKELRRRRLRESVTENGVPHDVDDRMNRALNSILFTPRS